MYTKIIWHPKNICNLPLCRRRECRGGHSPGPSWPHPPDSSRHAHCAPCPRVPLQALLITVSITYPDVPHQCSGWWWRGGPRCRPGNCPRRPCRCCRRTSSCPAPRAPPVACSSPAPRQYQRLYCVTCWAPDILIYSPLYQSAEYKARPTLCSPHSAPPHPPLCSTPAGRVAAPQPPPT